MVRHEIAWAMKANPFTPCFGQTVIVAVPRRLKPKPIGLEEGMDAAAVVFAWCSDSEGWHSQLRR